MMTRKIIWLCLTGLFVQPSSAQIGFRKNDVYLQLGGNGIVASLNYERQLNNQPGWGLRIGMGGVPGVGVSVPAGVHYLIKTVNEKAFIDAGYGLTFLFNSTQASDRIERINYVPSVGYRRHTSTNTLLRFSFTPVFNRSFVLPLVGFSFGKRF